MCAAVDGVSFSVGARRACDAARPIGLRQDHDAARRSPGWRSRPAERSASNGDTVYSAAERRNVPAEKRGVSMVFQSYAIWPHMTVFDNVAYGLRVRKLPRAEIAVQRDARAGSGADARFRRPSGVQAFGRPAAARGAGARDRVFADGAAVRRAAVQSRRQAARPRCGWSCASCSSGSASPRSM